ncbi:MAG: TIGR02680 family protein [Halioglobus sp.]|nr:TIGR02680 family protein [Halioglobus sp.]
MPWPAPAPTPCSAIRDAQQALAARREEQIAQVRRRLDAVDAAHATHRQAQSERDARYADTEAAEAAVAGQREATHAAAAACVDAWGRFAERAAPVLPVNWPDIPETLADWVTSLDGACPLDSLVDAAARRRQIELTERDSDARQHEVAAGEELELLRAEHAALSAGGQPEPPAPATRAADRSGRPGAPLWQCVDFDSQVSEAGRAGLEAALQASGLLDAWVTPAGELLAPETEDVWLTPRPRQPRNLGDYLSVAIDRGDEAARALDADNVAALLAGIAVVEGDDKDDAEDDDRDETAEAWISSGGRYRIGPLRGAWSKPVAEYIGFAAREAARRRRLAALDEEIAALRSRLDALAAERRELAQQRERLDALLAERPGADALRAAHAELGAAEKAAGRARERLAEAEAGLQSAHNALSRARDELELDAADAQLPAARTELDQIKAALDAYRLQLAGLHAAIRDHAGAIAELAAQRERERVAREDRDRARALADEQRRHAGKTAARHRELQSSLGASAAEVLNRLSALQTDYRELQQREKAEQDALVAANKALGGAESEAKNCAARQRDMLEARTAAVADFRAFADTGLLRAAAPELDMPDSAREWTVDPALSAARGAEQALQTVDDSDEDYKRVRERLGSEFTELERALSARGYRSFLEPGDHGSVVRVMFNQREQAPDRLQALLDAEIGERQSLLSAKEREIIENHLELEVAAQLQQLMREADERMRRINAELDQRPTSTGVKFKLVWQPRDDDDGAALAGLADVRKLLLHTSSDAWSAANRAAVGDFLQARIAAERERDDGVARIDQLARALDYRAWHQFRVQRWQDGKWRRLSGPASSGERALGLTVPLFAAASSHYESAAATAPRLVMLDEAFAGIDDAARAHCMDLIREFDLDFVMTSEREWGCYAELPGVAICHLVRREGVDAVHVSRWRWNGRTREAAPEPAPMLEAAGAGESGAGA